MNSKELTKTVYLLLVTVMLFTACSSDKKSTNNDETGIDFTSTTKKDSQNATIGSSVNESASIKSEVGARAFVYKIASAFVSTDLQDDTVLKKYLSSTAETGLITNLILRNKSDVSPSITFSPIGTTIDSYENDSAQIAVLGISYTSGASGITSGYKEILFNLSFEKTWKINSYILSDVKGISGNGENLDPSFLLYLDSFLVPSDEFVVGDRKVVNSSKVDNGNSGVTTTVLPVE